MEPSACMALDAPTALIAATDEAIETQVPYGPTSGGRVSEARRFLFAAAHHGKRDDASLGTFPGKFAWIAVVLFVLSVLIAFVG